jgi:hypothetical protein
MSKLDFDTVRFFLKRGEYAFEAYLEQALDRHILRAPGNYWSVL